MLMPAQSRSPQNQQVPRIPPVDLTPEQQRFWNYLSDLDQRMKNFERKVDQRVQRLQDRLEVLEGRHEEDDRGEEQGDEQGDEDA